MTQPLERQAGGLYVQTPEQQQIAFPLKHTEVQAKIAGNISRVEVTQSFENPFTTTLEAVYIFPLPDEAAVDDMVIQIGDKTIKGSIKKRQEAQQIYEQAKQQGRTAGLLEQERDNIFTQSLANIQPGEQIDVIIRYSESLKFTAGNYEFVFPMVVAPRYIPGIPIDGNAGGVGSATAPMTQNQDTDIVPDGSRLNAPILPSGTRSPHDINVTVEIDAGVEVQNVQSPSHQLQVAYEGKRVLVKLAGGDTIPNKDLILRYQVAGESTQATVLSQADERGGHFALYLIPALQYRQDQVVPKDVVFLIDTSGSQMGAPLMQCQELMRRFINGLNPDDTFSIIDFSDTTRQLSPVPLSNNSQNRTRAINYINRLTANGGTEMSRGILSALNFPVTDTVRLRSIVLLTDGYIGNENQILSDVQRYLQPRYRLYSFGAGSSVNRFLLNRIAELGRGISHIIRHDEPTDEVVDKFYRQINNPVLTNINLQWEGDGDAPIIYPTTPPDLFAEQPLVLFGKKPDARGGKLHITGIVAGGTRYQHTFNLDFEEAGNPAIAQLWGRSRIKELMNQMVSGDTKLGVEAVTDTALTYQLLSQYTAFVAVSDDVRVDSRQGSVSVQVPVEMAEGISYQGIFGSAVSAVAPKVSAISPAPEFLQRKRRVESPGAPEAESFLCEAPSPPKFAQRAYRSFDEDFEDVDLLEAEELVDKVDPVERLQVVSVTGLNEQMVALLTQHLKSASLFIYSGGDLVFELQINKGRVRQVLLDEQTSTFKEQSVIDIIRRSLVSWRIPQLLTATVSITLRLQT
ncbi:after-VIT domain-containing protein [Nostoc sp. FACHB-87]|uniref:VIT domain-containing protein n=1 Tax=Nostocaceae TaxID=1162 RepID=UPI0016859875|nr:MULTISPECIES: VIT domain-containing protein [Nostocaceae]MBD2457897.1 after-VIT domain-containing protein [Nostoc sp. FACHB-87]MBD2478876.1 after-VIT domain-containing protein [Anabaena sp. FACHB-83]